MRYKKNACTILVLGAKSTNRKISASLVHAGPISDGQRGRFDVMGSDGRSANPAVGLFAGVCFSDDRGEGHMLFFFPFFVA